MIQGIIMNDDSIQENENLEKIDEDDAISSQDELSEETSGGGDIFGIIEAILFISSEPVPLNYFTKQMGIDATQAKIIIDSLIDEYEDRDRGIKLVEISGGYQFVTNPKFAATIRQAMGYKKKETLSKGMLETLAIIAYKQPIMLAEIEELRGVSSRMMLAALMRKNLIRPVGRKDIPGRPLLYGTTDEFLKYFGLNKLSDLPKLSEIKEYNFEEE